MIYLTPGFRKMLAEDRRDYLAYADITLASGETLNLTNEEIWGDGFEVEDAVSDDENFTALGAAVINAASIIIDNTSGQYTHYDFLNADVVLKIALMVEDTTGERKEDVKMGTFRVDDTQYNEATISLSMLDMMEQFDRPYSLSTLIYPATLAAIVQDACDMCAVTLGTLTFPHSDFTIAARPTEESTTFREVIGWAATIAGCFARCNRDGELELKWFNTAALEDTSGTDGGVFDDGTPSYTSGDSLDGGTFSPWNNGSAADGGDFTTTNPLHYIGSLYAQNICVDDTVITGVSAEVEDKEANAEEQKKVYSTGSSGYMVQISGNDFLTKDNAQQVVNWLGQQLIGLVFRKCNVTHTDDPAIEAGDVGLLYDSRQNEYKILITRQKFEIGSPQTIVCGCDTPSHNSATRFSSSTKSYVAARKMLKQQANKYDLAMAQMRRDITNARGLYADEIEDPDSPGANIYCLHDKPQISESPVRIHISTVGIAVTANATDQVPDWYGFKVDGTLLASVIQTMSLFFDYAHGGTLKLGGAGNGNGLIQVFDANHNQIGSWGKDGLFANSGGKLTSKNGKVYVDLDNNEIACNSLVSADSDYMVDVGKFVNALFRYSDGIRLIHKDYANDGILVSPVSKSDGSYRSINRIDSNGEFEISAVDTSSITRTSPSFGAKLCLNSDDVALYKRWSDPSDSSYHGYFGIELTGDATNNGHVYITGAECYLPRNSYLENSWRKIAYESSSAKRYKHDIKPIQDEDLDPHLLLKLPVVQFVFDKEHEYDDMPGGIIPGIIAEDVEKIYPHAAVHKDGKIETWDERRIIPGMLALIQEQDQKIKEQEQEIADLKKQVEEIRRILKLD